MLQFRLHYILIQISHRSHCVNDLQCRVKLQRKLAYGDDGDRKIWPLAVLQGGRIKHVKGFYIQEIKCDFAGPKRGGRNNGVAILTGWP